MPGGHGDLLNGSRFSGSALADFGIGRLGGKLVVGRGGQRLLPQRVHPIGLRGLRTIGTDRQTLDAGSTSRQSWMSFL